jgi:light-regulated signal transduction histidine kinase (bacteriophytochrome)
MIHGLLWNWIRDYKSASGERMSQMEMMRKTSVVKDGYLETYNTSVLNKERPDYLRLVDLKETIHESFKRLLPEGVELDMNVDTGGVSHVIYQPYHLQGVIDGLIMNAIWSCEIAGCRKYKISIGVSRKGNQLFITQANNGKGLDFEIEDKKYFDLGASISIDSLDIRRAGAKDGPDMFHGNWKILGPTNGYSAGFGIILNDAKFVE